MSAFVQTSDRRVTPSGWRYSSKNRRSALSRSRKCASARVEQGGDSGPVYFTLEEHLLVQAQIERRALELWQARGCPHNAPLTDWLKAEAEVIRDFAFARQFTRLRL